MRSMFQSATITLTLVYIGLLAMVSFFFSYNWYGVATSELDRQLVNTRDIIERGPSFRGNVDLEDFFLERAEQIKEAKQNIGIQILISNLLVLGVGGIGSYFLAKKTLQPVEEAHEAQTRFTADASHELRTPLAAMRSEIEVALRDKKLTKKDASALLQSNLEELEKLTALSDGLLKLARQEQDVTLVSTALAPVLESVVKKLSQKATDQKIIVNYKPTKLVAMAHEASLEELLVILVDNAIKYSSPNSEVDIAIVQTKQTITITVKDSGTGIKASDVPHIFDRFFRADSSRTHQQNNSYGLGLSIAKDLAEIHKTKINVDSKLGAGSTFGFALKAAKIQT